MRSFAYITTAIWRDPEFLELSPGAQRLYFVALTRPNISACGVLQVSARRLAQLSAHTTEDDIVAAIDELAAARFFVVDYGVEEVLVRTFVKHDGGVNNAPRRKAIISAAKVVESPIIRDAIEIEFRALGLPVDGLDDDSSEGASDAPSEVPMQGSCEAPSEGSRVVVTGSTTGKQPATHIPQSSSLNPHHSSPKPKSAGDSAFGDMFVMPK